MPRLTKSMSTVPGQFKDSEIDQLHPADETKQAEEREHFGDRDSSSTTGSSGDEDVRWDWEDETGIYM